MGVTLSSAIDKYSDIWGSIAQWLEHWSCEPGVTSSNLVGALLLHFNHSQRVDFYLPTNMCKDWRQVTTWQPLDWRQVTTWQPLVVDTNLPTPWNLQMFPLFERHLSREEHTRVLYLCLRVDDRMRLLSVSPGQSRSFFNTAVSIQYLKAVCLFSHYVLTCQSSLVWHAWVCDRCASL